MIISNKYIVRILSILILISSKASSQKNIIYNDNGISIKLPNKKNYTLLPLSVSKDIKVEGTFNIVTFQEDEKDFENNHFSIYGFDQLSKIKFESSKFTDIKEKFKYKISNIDYNLKESDVAKFKSIILNIENKVYKNNPDHYNEFKEFLDTSNYLSSITKYLEVKKPKIIFESENGFLTLTNMICKVLNIEMFVPSINGILLVSNQIIGISGNLGCYSKDENNNKIQEIKNYFTQILEMNPSIKK
jgi:hypothetical protein